VQKKCNTIGKKKKKETEYNYNYITITTSPKNANAKPNRNTKKYPNIFHLYVPDGSLTTVEKTKEIADREGESLSQKFIKFCVNYNRLHGHGNPQTLMEKFTDIPKTKTICDHQGCEEPAIFEVWAHNKWHGYLCSLHRQRNNEARLLKRWKKL